MPRIRVAVLFGGSSNEYEVSLRSAASVIANLDRDRYEVTRIGITREGAWYCYEGEHEAIEADRWQADARCYPVQLPLGVRESDKYLLVERSGTTEPLPVDVVFPVLHGRYGEDGTLQGLLELAGLPYVGCGVAASAMCMDKAVAQATVRGTGIRTARAVEVRVDEDRETAAARAGGLTYPLYVKPVRSGSSIGMTMARDRSELLEGLDRAFDHDDKVLIEEEVDGFEVGCALLGETEPELGVIDEVELAPGGFFDYEEKYSLRTSAIRLPARLDAAVADEVRRAARRIYRALGCRGLARVDLFVTAAGGVVFNEVNTMPGFTAHSRYPRMWAAAGVAFPELLDRIVAAALAREPQRCE
ncbi:D-alanine--D-alanine ligase [Paenibacillus sp. IB182496]|uniref:D-alanine--D-alanine ligase n=1 Tax=Paenibacillus sabuli TaxID=2772509 RepID=A0A927BQD9_9BACL|nr:D-alanine--D-alanine ligase family protein [Paenibacillus sabuli]MBD2843593.1 D-alanine--D-alanine ligase [Paenibacillus sabuli]